MFDANREPDRCIANANPRAQLGRYPRVCRGAGMAGERLGSYQTDGKLEDLHSIEASERFREPTLDIEGKGRAGTRTLRLIDSALGRICGEERQIVHPRDPGMIAQIFGHNPGIAIATLHAQPECLERPPDHPAGVWIELCADRTPKLLDRLRQALAPQRG